MLYCVARDVDRDRQEYYRMLLQSAGDTFELHKSLLALFGE